MAVKKTPRPIAWIACQRLYFSNGFDVNRMMRPVIHNRMYETAARTLSLFEVLPAWRSGIAAAGGAGGGDSLAVMGGPRHGPSPGRMNPLIRLRVAVRQARDQR